jgi:hypothetical protein
MSTTTDVEFDFQNLIFRYDPFPIGVCHNVLPTNIYSALCKRWPPTDLFAYKANLGDKYSLSEINNPHQFYSLLNRDELWRDVYKTVKSPAFIRGVLERLCDAEINLGLMDRRISARHRFSPKSELPGALSRRLMRALRPSGPSPLTARFEFSMLPAAGGHIKPHTDAPQKLVTLVVSLFEEGSWNDAWGGGTEVQRPKDIRRNFNHLNRQFGFDEVDTIEVMPFKPNQCIVFVKTFNSFHAVSPMHGPNDGTMRKTLTINIESWG